MKKDKKVLKAHQGMAHVPKQNTKMGSQPTSTSDKAASMAMFLPPPSRTRGPIAPRPQLPRIQRDSPLRQPAVVGPPIKRPPRISDGPLDGGGRGITGGIRRRPPPTAAQQKEINTGREIDRRMRGNKVVRDNQADMKSRYDAALKKRGGAMQVFNEQMDYYRGGRKGKRPERIDPFKGMSSREQRRAKNASRSEFDETNRQVRKQMGTQTKPRQPRVGLGGIQLSPFKTVPQRRNKGGAVKKKYSEVKTLKQGGYVSRAKYGSVDNLNKKK